MGRALSVPNCSLGGRPCHLVQAGTRSKAVEPDRIALLLTFLLRQDDGVGEEVILMSVKIRIKATGEIREVSNNEAFDLIDSHKAVLYHGENLSQASKSTETPRPVYQDRQMRPLKK